MAEKAIVGDLPTRRQVDVLRAIRDLSARTGLPPTYRELAAALGLASHGVYQHVQRARAKGLIHPAPVPVRAGSLRLTELGARRAR